MFPKQPCEFAFLASGMAFLGFPPELSRGLGIHLGSEAPSFVADSIVVVD